MNKQDLRRLSNLRRREARALLSAGQYAGAYYLAGYAVECALKACVAAQTQKHDFPDKKFAAAVYTHDLETLLKLSGLQSQLHAAIAANATLGVNWAVVKDWKETSRYELGIPLSRARDFYSACTARQNGILSWIRRQW